MVGDDGHAPPEGVSKKISFENGPEKPEKRAPRVTQWQLQKKRVYWKRLVSAMPTEILLQPIRIYIKSSAFFIFTPYSLSSPRYTLYAIEEEEEEKQTSLSLSFSHTIFILHFQRNVIASPESPQLEILSSTNVIKSTGGNLAFNSNGLYSNTPLSSPTRRSCCATKA